MSGHAGALIFGVGLAVVANGCAVGQATSTKVMLKDGGSH